MEDQPKGDEQLIEEHIVEPEPEEPELLTREDLLRLPEENLHTEVVEGFRVRAVSGEEYQRIEAMRWSAAADTSGDGIAQSKLAEMTAWLTYGVVEPRIKPEEWSLVMKQPGMAGRLKEAAKAIQRLSGVGDWEAELTKNALERAALIRGS